MVNRTKGGIIPERVFSDAVERAEPKLRAIVMLVVAFGVIVAVVVAKHGQPRSQAVEVTATTAVPALAAYDASTMSSLDSHLRQVAGGFGVAGAYQSVTADGPQLIVHTGLPASSSSVFWGNTLCYQAQVALKDTSHVNPIVSVKADDGSYLVLTSILAHRCEAASQYR
jgi:hypothetical protein